MSEELKVTEEGKFLINGVDATNEQLSSYFDFAKYTDATEQRYVEGILKSNTVTVNGVKYSSVMDNNGHLISEDGTQSISPSMAKEIFGEKGYNALVAKKMKVVTVDNNGVTISNPEQPVDFQVNNELTEAQETASQPVEPSTETPGGENQEGGTPAETPDGENQEGGTPAETPEETPAETPTETPAETPVETPSSPGGSSHSSSPGGSSHSSSPGGSYPSSSSSSYDDSSSSSNSTDDSDSSDNNDKKTKKSAAKTEVIVVEIDKLRNIQEQIVEQQNIIKTQFDEFDSNVKSVTSTGAWNGDDADKYVSAKSKYVDSSKTIANVFNNFAKYLEICVDQYEKLEENLPKNFN